MSVEQGSTLFLYLYPNSFGAESCIENTLFAENTDLMLQTVSNTNKEKQRQEIIFLLNKISEGNWAGNGYYSDKQAIENLFAKTDEREKEDILLRLTVIDSMYSTQMSKRYYGLEDLAEAMYALQEEKGLTLKNLFIRFAESCDASLFDYQGRNLFANSYGIGKDAGSKGVAISLISKYAYFCTNYKFPIFDSIVCETLPRLRSYLGLPKRKLLKVHNKDKSNSYRIDGMATMVNFTAAINAFFQELNIPVSYDSLDRLLWFVGKIRRGNLSLVLSKSEYKKSVEYCGKVLHISMFDIEKIEKIESLPFVKPELIPFFRLAKTLGTLVKYSKTPAKKARAKTTNNN